jgi:hypothetical protein
MEWITRLMAATSAAFALLAFSSTGTPVAAPPPETVPTTLYEAPSPVSVAPTTTIPADARCPQWWGMAQEAGWTIDLLPTLDYVMWRESRCDPTQHNTTLNRDKSSDIGLTQINDRSWCLPTRWYPGGYLQTVGVLPTVGCEQLFDPYTNLKAAKALYDYSEQTNGNGWEPWQL